MVMPYSSTGPRPPLPPPAVRRVAFVVDHGRRERRHAHAFNVILRDVGPGNCLWWASVARLADFELVRHQC